MTHRVCFTDKMAGNCPDDRTSGDSWLGDCLFDFPEANAKPSAQGPSLQ